MRSRIIASLLALSLFAQGAAAFQDLSTFPIEYPLKGYRLADQKPDNERRARDLKALRARLTVSSSIAFVDSGNESEVSPVTGLPLGRAVRPIRILWNDPRYLFRAPAVVEWIEQVDERGRITRVWVTTSNQSPRDDARIIGWCTNDALWQPVELEGRSSSTLRTAGVSLSGSPYHYTTWTAKLRTGPGLVIAGAAILFALWMVGRVLGYKRQQRLRHAQLMERLHRTSPYKPPSVDDEMS